MTQEEKAKAYDKVREKIALRFGPNVAEEIFSEFEDSDDEKLRKSLIKHFRGYQSAHFDGFSSIEVIAWLEKQGNKDIRYKHLEELLAADDIYQMSMNQDMVEEAKTKAINALSKLCISKLLLENQNHDGKKWIYEDVFYLKEKEQLIQDGIDEVLENPEKYGLVKKCEQKSSSLNGLKFGVGDIVKSKSQPMLKPMEIKSVGEDCYYCEGGNLIGFAWENDYEIVEKKELSQSKVTKISDQECSVEFDENLMMIEDRFSDYLDYIREDSSLTKHRKNTLKEEIIGYVNWLKTLKERLSL